MDINLLWQDLRSGSGEYEGSDETDSDTERQRQEEEEAELYSKLHYAEHFELEEVAQNDTKDSFETLDENIDNDLAASKDIDIKYHDPAAQAGGPGAPEISQAYSTINHAHPSGSEAGRNANKEKSLLDIAPCTTTDDVQRSILEAKMGSPERDSGSSSLKTVSEASSEDIQPIKNSPSKYNDAEPSKSAVNSRLVPIIPATDFVDISSSSESESDDGIQVVEHHETRQKPPPLATITLDDADSSGDEVEIDVKNNTFRQKNSYKTQSVITSTGGRCLNAPNQGEEYSDISSQDNSILENSEPDENSVSKKCQNNKGLADIEDISSDEVVIESVKSEKSTQQSTPSNSFLNHLQSWKNTSNDSKPVSTPKNAAFRVTVKDETDCSVKKRKSLSRQHSSSSSSSSSSSEGEDEKSSPSLSLNVIGGTKNLSDKNVNNARSVFLRVVKQAKEAAEASPGTRSPVKFNGWSEEMHQFYDQVTPEEMEGKSLEQTLSIMSDDPKDWKVSAQDRYASAAKSPGGPSPRGRGHRSFRSGPQCHNCNRQGHLAKECPEKAKPIACFMCGGAGHLKDECPNSKCLKCGNPQEFYSNRGCVQCKRLSDADCFNCGGRGHTRTTCPDNWRRYHATISASPGESSTNQKVVIPPKEDLLQNNNPWCCNCAKQGHYVHQCRAYSYSAYPASNPLVVTYSDPTCPESLDVEGSEEDLNDSTHQSGQDTLAQNSRGSNRKRKAREMKAKRREFLGLGTVSSTPPENKKWKFSENGTATPIGYKGRWCATPSRKSNSDEEESISHRLEKAQKSLDELLADKAESEANFTSRKQWRHQKRQASKVRKIESSSVRKVTKRNTKKNSESGVPLRFQPEQVPDSYKDFLESPAKKRNSKKKEEKARQKKLLEISKKEQKAITDWATTTAFAANKQGLGPTFSRLKERKTKALQKKNARQTAKAMGIHWQNRHLSDKWIDYCNQMGANNSGIRDKKQT